MKPNKGKAVAKEVNGKKVSWLGSGKIIDSKNNIYNVSENGEIDPIIPKGTILSGYAFKWNLPKADGEAVIGIQ
jgi:hypothetical protein